MSVTEMKFMSLKRLLVVAALPIVIGASEGISWVWVHPSEPSEGRTVLSYSFPNELPSAKKEEVDLKTKQYLKCDTSLTGWIDCADEGRVNLYYFEWNNTDSQGLSHAFGHQPEICMKNLGNELVETFPGRVLSVDGFNLVFDVTQFTDENGRPLYIFKLSWTEGWEGKNLLRYQPGNLENKMYYLRLAISRRVLRYARVLMLGVFGAQNEQQAWKLVEENVLGDLSFVKIKD